MDIKNFASAISQIAEEKGISSEKVLESIEQALAAAYKKDYGNKGQTIRAQLSPETGDVKFWQIKVVVDESMIYSEEELEELKGKKEEEVRKEPSSVENEEKIRFNPEKHIMLKEAQTTKPKIKVINTINKYKKSYISGTVEINYRGRLRPMINSCGRRRKEY